MLSTTCLLNITDWYSNGIRFSITDLTEPTGRILPTLYSDRNKISLYEAQYDDDGNQIPIPEDIMQSVIAAFLRFQLYCTDFGVPPNHIRIVATEATRKAINADDFIDRISRQTGLNVEILSQADEGEVGAWGVASSNSEVRGLVMDLGGGSTQITWMLTSNGKMQISPKIAFSFPYGAAALTQRLKLINRHKSKDEAEAARRVLRDEMKTNFLNAYHGLEVPEVLIEEAKKEGGFKLYLSGGGFRGWGYLLIYEAQTHTKAYPISIVNGFVARKRDFTDVRRLEKAARDAKSIFRVSDRRRAQVPAVAFLVSVLAEIIPHGIKEAHFCQGGVREGVLFRTLKPEVRMQSPIEVATAPYASPLAPKLARFLDNSLPDDPRSFETLDSSDQDNGWEMIPSESSMRRLPPSFTTHILQATANMLYYHSGVSKELSSVAALYTTSTGILADTHGTSHRNRAILALLLEARFEGDLPPRDHAYREALQRLLTPPELWWINYLGAVALVLSRVYPAGVEEDLGACNDNSLYLTGKPQRRRRKPHLELKACFANDLGKMGKKFGIRLTFTLTLNEHNKDDPMKVEEELALNVKKIEKVGKKKHWIKTASDNDGFADGYVAPADSPSNDDDNSGDDDNNNGWGMKVAVEIEVRHSKPEYSA